MKQGTPREERRQGMVLVLVVVLLGLVVAMVVESQVAARLSLRIEEARLRTVRLRVAMTDTARFMLQQLADDPLPDVDHLDEDWAQPQEVEHPSGVAVWSHITDMNRYFDINNLYLEQATPKQRPASEILMDIMTICEDFTPIDRVQALRDWIDPDDEGFRESDHYMKQDEPYACPNRWVNAWSELPFVSGFSRDYFLPRERFQAPKTFQADLVDCIRAHPGRRSNPTPINVNTATREALLGVLGIMEEEWVRYILVLRKEHPLVSLDPIMTVGDQARIKLVKPYLSVNSDLFEIQVRAFEGGQAEELWALARRDRKGNVHVERWVF